MRLLSLSLSYYFSNFNIPIDLAMFAFLKSIVLKNMEYGTNLNSSSSKWNIDGE